MERSLNRPKRASASLPTPQLSQSLQPTHLRRSARLGATAGLAPSQFTLATTSHKRKRTPSTSSERSPSRSSKRSHTLPVDTPVQSVRPYDALFSPRLERHRRRHPSVFEGEDPLDTQTEGATASTSTSPLALKSFEDTLNHRRTRKKENRNSNAESRSKGKDSVQYSIPSSSLKGKERASSVATRDDFSFSTRTIKSAIGDSPQLLPDAVRLTRSRTPNEPALQLIAGPSSSVGFDDAPTKPDDEAVELTSRRRLRSTSSSKPALKATSKKRKREPNVVDENSRKKLKSVAPEVDNPDAESSPSDDIAPAISISSIPTTLPYPKSLPYPIPSVIITPPSPPNSPPLPVLSDLPIIHNNQGSDDEDSASVWDLPVVQPVPPSDSSSLEHALSSIPSSSHPAGPSSSDVGCSQGCSTKRVCRRYIIIDRPPETLFRLACREKIDHLKNYYLSQLQEYEADLAYQFFNHVSSDSSVTPSTPDEFVSIPSPTRPQSPTWHYEMHWQNRLRNAGEWDGQVQDMHPTLSPKPPKSPLALSPSMFTLPSGSAGSWDGHSWNNIPDGDSDFRTEDCFPFELDESDEDDEDHHVQLPLSDPPGEPRQNSPGSTDEESEDTESDVSEENDDVLSIPAVQGEGQVQLDLPVYVPTPSSLAEALTPLEPCDNQDPTTGVFALPVSPLSKQPEAQLQQPSFVIRPDEEENSQCFIHPLPLPPPSLATVIPEETRLHDADQLSAMFQQEILPEYAVARVKTLLQSDTPPSAFSPTSTPAFLVEVRQQATARLRTPFTRLLNYASKTLGTIGQGTPIDPKRRMSVVAWLEDQKIVQHDNVEASIPPLGSASWYATRFPSSLSLPSTLNPTPQSSMPVITTSSPEALLFRTNLQPEGTQSSFDGGNWPPLTIEPSELDVMRNHRWTEPKNYFSDGAVAAVDVAQNAEFPQGSNRECGSGQVQYQYPPSSDRGTPTASAFSSSRLSPEIAMDESLSDEDAEGDIDPDVVQSASSIPPTGPDLVTTDESQRRLMPTVAHGSGSYSAPAPAPISSFSGLRSSNEVIGLSASGSAFRHGSRYGSNGFHATEMDISAHEAPSVEMPLSVPVASRSFPDSTGPSNFPNTGIHGVGLSLNVGVSVMGMGINLDMMGVGVGFGMGIGFPALEPESWFLPSSPPPSSLPSSNEENEHALGSFENNSMYVDTLPDHTRERFSSPGSPENAYPLGFAMG